MIYPKFLEKNNCIGVPAPSAGASTNEKQNRINNSQKRIKSMGYKIQLSKNAFSNVRGRSAIAIDRANEINEMFANEKIDLMMCLSGGDFLVEILPYIDFELIKKHPKFITGFSDPTGILYPITTKCDIATIYGQNFSSLGSDLLHKSELDFFEIIKGNLISQNSFKLYENERYQKITGLEGYNLTEKVKWKTLDNKKVSIKGRIIGGCFDIIAELAGTKYDGIKEFNEKYKEDGIIWYFDNCEFSMEETIRVLWKFNELDYFKYAKGIIFGRFGIDTTYYEYDVKSCLEDSAISKLGIPIIYDADISHKGPSLTIINGAISNVTVDSGKAKIDFELK